MPQEVSIIVALCALAVVYAGTIPSGSLPKLAPRRTTNRQNLPARGHQLPEVRKRYLHMAINDSCRNFEHYQNSVTLKGEVLRKVGEGVVPSLCTQACLDTSDFVCAAALIQLPSTCFVTGYRLRDDYYSKHYYRVCASGPSCFVEKRGVTAGFTDSFAIPWYFVSSPDIQPIYCMAHCEQMVSCVGFDLKQNPARCIFQDLGQYTDYSFDMYIRRC